MAVLYQMWEIKSAMAKLAREKENAVRAQQGLPPILPWYEQCCVSIKNKLDECKTKIRESLLQTFCPCTVYDPNRHLKRKTAKTCFGRLWIDATYENQVLKSFLGFFGGFLVTLLWFALMVFYMKYAFLPATVTCIILGTVLSIGLAFSERVRCLTLLTLPQLFSSKGRSVLLATCFVLALNGPMQNFRNNIHVMSETASCGQEVTREATKQVVDAALAPVKDVLSNIRAVLKALKRLALKLRDAVLKIRDLFKEVITAVSRVLKWLGNIVNVCNDNMGAPYAKCSAAFTRAETDCRNRLGGVGFMCDIVKGISHICHVARVGELLCSIPASIKSFMVNHITSGINIALKNVYEMFYFNVTLHYHYDVKLEQSKTFAEIREDIHEEIEARIQPLIGFTSLNHAGLVFMMTWLVLKAVLYKRKFMSKDRFDNFYITWHVMDIEVKREKAEKETIFPLNWKEKSRYIRTVYPRLAKQERRKLIIGLVFLGASGLHLSLQIACDFGLYWLLSMIRIHGELKTHENVPAHLKMHVQGEGILADIYRSMITQFDPLEAKQISVDTTPCLPNPSPPDYDVYIRIGYIYATCILLVFTQSYGLRLRHIVAACYYPKREKARAVWLYNHILRRRGSLLLLLRRKLRRKHETEANEEKTSILAVVAAKSPTIGKILRKLGLTKVKHCLCCGLSGKLSDKEDFIHCENRGCDGVYCVACYGDLNNMCTVCMNPVEYGDHSDFSEERDSSDMNIPKKKVRRRKQARAESSSESSSEDSDDLDYSYQDRKDLDGESSSGSDQDSPRKGPTRRAPIEAVSVHIFGSSSDSESLTDSSSSGVNEPLLATRRQAINRS